MTKKTLSGIGKFNWVMCNLIFSALAAVSAFYGQWSEAAFAIGFAIWIKT
jgi:hypothetical protein